MLRMARVLGIGAVATAAIVAVSCGGDDPATSTTTGTGGTTASSTSSSASSTVGAGGAMPCPSGDGTTLALTKLDFGPGNSGEWKSIGLNVDGLVSTANATDVCQLN